MSIVKGRGCGGCGGCTVGVLVGVFDQIPMTQCGCPGRQEVILDSTRGDLNFSSVSERGIVEDKRQRRSQGRFH
jgi:hypothetical protein